ncbi:hypothetical protein D9M68_377300 [compost metagenome]
MDRTLPASTQPGCTAQPTRPGRLLRLLGLFALWAQRVRTRRQLAQLDERLLADVGISRSERSAELRKPFWR